MIVELDLLNCFSKKDNYDKYSKFIKDYVLTSHAKKIISDLGAYYTTYPSDVDWGDFSLWFKTIRNTSMSLDDQEQYQEIFEELDKLPLHGGAGVIVDDVIQRFIELAWAATIQDKLQHIIDGTGKSTLVDVMDDVESYISESDIDTSSLSITVENNLADLLDKCVRSDGAEWRLEDLNVSIGPLHRGDFGIIGARPEVGKTTFVMSEITHMIEADCSFDKAVIFNNEEAGEKILLRSYQSALNRTLTDIMGKPEADVIADYAKVLRDKDAIEVEDSADLNVSQIEKIIKKKKPDIVIFNVMDKVKGFNKAGNEVERLRELFKWGRGIAKRFNCIVIAVAQADGSAEGEQWVYQNQLYGSKTGIQGEADFIITVGKVHDPALENVRFIHVPKNKLPGGPRTDPSKRHGYHQVDFDGDRGRFKSATY